MHAYIFVHNFINDASIYMHLKCLLHLHIRVAANISKRFKKYVHFKFNACFLVEDSILSFQYCFNSFIHLIS